MYSDIFDRQCTINVIFDAKCDMNCNHLLFFFNLEDHLLITGLRPSTVYTVVVESRKVEKYKDYDEKECECK